jgi:hypothetical protein
MSMDTAERQPGQFASERFRERNRAWLRRVWWRILLVLASLTAAEAAIALLVGGASKGFFSGFGAGAVIATLMLTADRPPHHIERWRQGADGERATARALRPLTANAWTVLHDIQTTRGNLDHLLIGPAGAFLLESKNLNGTVTVHQGLLSVRWKEDPDDGYEQAHVAARVRGAAAELADRLRSAGQPVWIQPIVVLWATFQQRSILSDGVAWIQGKNLAAVLTNRPRRLTDTQVDDLAAAVRLLPPALIDEAAA